jgi:hypothetical protein
MLRWDCDKNRFNMNKNGMSKVGQMKGKLKSSNDAKLKSSGN